MRSFVSNSFVGGQQSSDPREAFAPSFPDYVEDVILAADTLVRVAIPTGARIVSFSFDGDFRARAGIVTDSFTLPAATTSNGSGSELNPAARTIPAGATHIILRAAAAQKGSLSFYG